MEPSPRENRTVRSAGEYLERIPSRIASRIAGREAEVEAALEAGDTSVLERAADRANALRIEGRTVSPEEVRIAEAPTSETLLGNVEDARRRAVADVLEGRIASQLFFAGAATRFGKAAAGLLFVFDIWEIAERIVATPAGEVPEFAEGMDPVRFGRLREEVAASAAAVPPRERLRIPLGARILLAYRSALERIAGAAGEAPERARSKAKFLVHLPESQYGARIAGGIARRRFFGFDPEGFLFIPQTLFEGWTVARGRVIPLAESRPFPYGHGYSTMQLVHSGCADIWADGAFRSLDGDPLDHIVRKGCRLIRTHRVNDLTQISPAILDLVRIAAGCALVGARRSVVIELVANPLGQKGGNWVSLAGDHAFLVEGLNAKVGGWPEFLERHRGAPYNAFRNLYDAEGLRTILLEHELPDHLRVRRLDGAGGGPRAGLYLESVTGDLTQIPEARAAAFRLDDREEIHDLKELKDLPEGIAAVAAQDLDEDFRRIAIDLGFGSPA